MSARGDDLDSAQTTDQKIRRSAARTVFNWLAVLLALGVIGAWGSTGIYYTQPGEAAVVLYLGRYHQTVRDEGIHWRLPVPLGNHETLNVVEVRRLEFGLEGSEEGFKDEDVVLIHQNEVQTSDSNIVVPRYVVQYRVKDPFTYLYSLKNPTTTLHDAAQAAMREVIGQHRIDAVLASNRSGIERDAKIVLIEILSRYSRGGEHDAAFEIRSFQLQSVQPPPQVQDAFDDVVAAKQDKDRAVSVAEGDAREIHEQASAEAVEISESAIAYKEAKVLDATGEARRFELLLAEYRNAK
ncbi:MAG: FtsH protease activity modulator HflK, partial [Deltaproteobacteria bacterium]|nr:FtsH protease activity modulator HflK [Deltaproteobacteria bacterium]